MTTLGEKQLIEVTGRLDVPGKPNLYGTTDTFLRCFGLASLEELPKNEVLDVVSGEASQENTEADSENSSVGSDASQNSEMSDSEGAFVDMSTLSETAMDS